MEGRRREVVMGNACVNNNKDGWMECRAEGWMKMYAVKCDEGSGEK